MSDNFYDTLVVGGGIAGLTSAAYLSRAGKKVLLIEKNKECGGLVNSFSRDGFTFDAGVRALEDAGIIFPMLKDLGISLEVVGSPVSLGIEDEIIHIENIGSLEKYRDLLLKLYPESGNEISRLMKSIRQIMKHMDVLYGIENPVFKDLKHDREFIFRTLLPWLPKFILTVGKINRMNTPVEDYLESFIKNRSLRDIIAQHFFKNTPTFFAMSYFSLYLDYFYPRGGVGKLAEAVRNKILEYGGEIKTETRIVRLDPKECLATDQDDVVYKYENLVWAADLKTLYSITETDSLPPETRMKHEAARTSFMKNRGGDSVFSLFVEVDEPPETFRNIAHGHFFYTPSRQGLCEIHRKELDDLLKDFDNTGKTEILEWLDRFANQNTYEISIPCLKDPELVPPGKTGIIISLLAEYDLFAKIRKAGWLDEFVAGLEDRMINVISGSVYPFLKAKKIAHFSFSPLNIETRVGSSEGAITGWAFREKMPVVNKIQYSDRSVYTPLPGIFQAGQWVYSPAGVPMSILTGKLAADKALHQLKKKGKKSGPVENSESMNISDSGK